MKALNNDGDAVILAAVSSSLPAIKLIVLRSDTGQSMRKEVIFAIILGLILGGFIVYGIYRANENGKEDIANPIVTSPTPTPTISPRTLTINEPVEGEIFFHPVATISGTINPTNRLVILDENDEYLVKPDQSGVFRQELDLNGGANKISIYSISPDGSREEQEINLVYTTELEI